MDSAINKGGYGHQKYRQGTENIMHYCFKNDCEKSKNDLQTNHNTIYHELHQNQKHAGADHADIGTKSGTKCYKSRQLGGLIEQLQKGIC